MGSASSTAQAAQGHACGCEDLLASLMGLAGSSSRSRLSLGPRSDPQGGGGSESGHAKLYNPDSRPSDRM